MKFSHDVVCLLTVLGILARALSAFFLIARHQG